MKPKYLNGIFHKRLKRSKKEPDLEKIKRSWEILRKEVEKRELILRKEGDPEKKTLRKIPRKDPEGVSGAQTGRMNYLCYNIFNYFRYVRYLWSTPDGPVFILKLLIATLDKWLGRLYPLNQNPICQSTNHSSVLSKKQNIGWFSLYDLQ